MIQDIKSGEKCVFGVGVGGQVILLVVSRGRSRVLTFSLEGGGVRQNLGNESRSQPPPPPDTEIMNGP